MDRIHTYTSLDEVTSAQLNSIQDAAIGLAQLNGLMVGGQAIWSLGGDIMVSPIEHLVLDGVHGGSTSALTITPSGLATSTRYYLYAAISGGAPVLEYSTTAPALGSTVAAPLFKTGFTSRRYLTTFVTDGAGAIRPFRVRAGRYLYRVSGGSSTAFELLNTYSSGTLTAQASGSVAYVSLGSGGLIPPHARTAIVRGVLRGNGTGNTLELYLSSVGDSVPGLLARHELTAGHDAAVSGDIETNTSGQIAYGLCAITGAPQTGCRVMVWLLGFVE